MNANKHFLWVIFLINLSTSCKKMATEFQIQNQATQPSTPEKWGVWFKCRTPERAQVTSDAMRDFLVKNMKWSVGGKDAQSESQVWRAVTDDGLNVGFFLNDQNKNTLEIAKRRPDLGIRNATLSYFRREFDPKKGPKGQLVKAKDPTTREIVSTKEIVAALLSAGRITEFAGNACSFELECAPCAGQFLRT